MTPTHEELRDALGAHALGQLDDDLQARVREHLETCAECRLELAEIMPLVPALSGVDPDALHPVGITPPVELDERIRRAIPGSGNRTRRWAPVTGAVLAAAASAAIITAVVVSNDPSGSTVIAVPRVETVQGVTASAGLVDHTWGVEIKLEASGLQAGERFRMWVVGDDGTTYDAGEILGVADTTIVCDMSSSVLMDDAASFRVVDAAGNEVIAGAISS